MKRGHEPVRGPVGKKTYKQIHAVEPAFRAYITGPARRKDRHPMQWLLIPFVVLSGVLNSLQTGNNTQLGKSLGQPIAAAFIVYLVGLLTLAVIAPFLGFSFSAYGRVGQAPWWAWVGGIFGALYILAMLYVTDKVGAGTFTALTVTAAIVTTVVIDHFGWLGLDRHPASAGRIIGCVLMVGGVFLVSKF